jgi:hypothetical protein
MKRMKRPKDWTESDLIRWVENRLAEQQDPYLKRDVVPPAVNLEIYLDRARDNLTLGQIAKKRFPTIDRPGSGIKWAANPAIGRVRCAIRQVETFLNPQHPQLMRRIRKEKKIERELQEYGIPAGVARCAFGCSPEYLLKQLQRKSDKVNGFGHELVGQSNLVPVGTLVEDQGSQSALPMAPRAEGELALRVPVSTREIVDPTK